MKKTLLFLIILYAKALWSGQMGQCQNVNVSSACAPHLWQLGGHGFYVQASSSGFQNPQISENLPWSWGFAIDASYQYDEGNALAINWYHLRSQNNYQLQDPLTYTNWIGNQVINGESQFDYLSIDNATTTINPAWDQVNIEMSKTMHMGVFDSLRLHGGGNYSHLAYASQQNLAGQLQPVNQAPTDFSQSVQTNTSYNGFGLRTGLSLSHDFQNHFSVFADGALSLLAGTAKSSQLIYFQTYDGRIASSQMRIVPELDGHIGTKYDYHLAQGLLSAEISWLWLNYFNALGLESNDFGLQGLYFGLTWSGDVN